MKYMNEIMDLVSSESSSVDQNDVSLAGSCCCCCCCCWGDGDNRDTTIGA